MKRKILVLTLVLALLLASLPSAAFAAAPAEVKVLVRNTTGAIAELRLTDADGNKIFKSLEPGVSDFTLTEGAFTVYVSTVCGAYADTWNVHVTRTLYIECKGADEPVVQYAKCVWVGENTQGDIYNHLRTGFFWNPKNNGYYNLEEIYEKQQGNLAPYITFERFVKGWVGTASCRYGVLPEDWHLGNPTWIVLVPPPPPEP